MSGQKSAPAARADNETRAAGRAPRAEPATAKARRSGSENRKRRHLEWFRTDDAEHAALQAKVRASGKSLGAFVMELAAIESGGEARARRRSDPPIDAPALLQAVAAFNRQHGNYNQAVRALNTLVLVADERSSHELAEALRGLAQEIAGLQRQFAEPLAAILGAVRGDRQG